MRSGPSRQDKSQPVLRAGNLNLFQELCPSCYQTDGQFDEGKIFDFLKNYYGNIRQDNAQEVGYKVNEYKDGKLRTAGNRHLNPKFAVHAEKVSFFVFKVAFLLLSEPSFPRGSTRIDSSQNAKFRSKNWRRLRAVYEKNWTPVHRDNGGTLRATVGYFFF